MRSFWRRTKNKNCWRPIEEMLEARLWFTTGTTSLIGDISFLWNITTDDKWKVYSKYTFTRIVMKHASIYIYACRRPFLWNKVEWRPLTGFCRYAGQLSQPPATSPYPQPSAPATQSHLQLTSITWLPAGDNLEPGRKAARWTGPPGAEHRHNRRYHGGPHQEEAGAP